MPKRFIAVASLFPIMAAFAPLDVSAQVPTRPTVAPIQAVQDSVIGMTFRKAHEVLDKAQRLAQDTSLFALANRALETAAALSNQLDAQRIALEGVLKQTEANLRAVLQQAERTQRHLDELMRQQPK